ncbi:hypothetical protein [Clostridium manihotivorum]|uniref:hypothetical protein n=1 Tax=Clostridium manihotivorum TaxID=2320868 RepID=UPI0013E2B2BB|nr:hypothetical protein [Clostridium manihotivorum]
MKDKIKLAGFIIILNLVTFIAIKLSLHMKAVLIITDVCFFIIVLSLQNFFRKRYSEY